MKPPEYSKSRSFIRGSALTDVFFWYFFSPVHVVIANQSEWSKMMPWYLNQLNSSKLFSVNLVRTWQGARPFQVLHEHTHFSSSTIRGSRPQKRGDYFANLNWSVVFLGSTFCRICSRGMWFQAEFWHACTTTLLRQGMVIASAILAAVTGFLLLSSIRGKLRK